MKFSLFLTFDSMRSIKKKQYFFVIQTKLAVTKMTITGPVIYKHLFCLIILG